MQKRKRFTLILSFLLILGIFSAVFVMAAEGVFTIKKVDQNKEPLEDVEFEVYGKPVLEVERKVVIQKLHNSSLRTGPLKEDVTINIKGNGLEESFTATRDSHSLEITVKPGTYTISEVLPEYDNDIALQVDAFFARQYYLTSGEFTIKEDGSLELGEMKWGCIEAAEYHDGSEWKIVYRYFDVTESQEDRPIAYSVELDGNIITVTNETLEIQQESQVQE